MLTIPIKSPLLRPCAVDVFTVITPRPFPEIDDIERVLFVSVSVTLGGLFGVIPVVADITIYGHNSTSGSVVALEDTQ